jgi:xylose isomerase-like TIM barrel protein
MNNAHRKSAYTRREFGKLAIAGVPAAFLFRGAPLFAAQINSKIKGVQIGAITYSFNRLQGLAANPWVLVDTYVKLGLAEMELMSNHAEAMAGAPAAARGGGGRGTTPTPEQQAAQAAAAKARTDWRAAATEATFAPVRDRIQKAGIALRLLCYNINSRFTDAEIEYGFKMAKWLGVKAMTTSTQVSMAKRIAPFAEKYNLRVGFHGHDSVQMADEVHNEASFMAVMAVSKLFDANLDVGHYTAAGGDAVDFMKKHHDRITNLHFKDMKRGQSDSYVPFGEGDAPLKEVLVLLSKEKWDIPANTEFEYAGDPMVEVPKCFDFIKRALA